MDGLKGEYDKAEQRISRLLDQMLDGNIEQDVYDKKLKELKDKQQGILTQMQEHSQGDEAFYLTASKVLNLANRAKEVFEGSEPDEKRALLGFSLQNCVLNGKELGFTLRKPFDAIATSNKTKKWQGRPDSNRQPAVLETAALPIRATPLKR